MKRLIITIGLIFYLILPSFSNDNLNSNIVVKGDSQTGYNITYYMDQEIGSSIYFRPLLNLLRTATERDNITFIINTPGGYVSSMLMIYTHLLKTKAYTIAEIYCALSAGSIIAMGCKELRVGFGGVMMIHSMQIGDRGSLPLVQKKLLFLEDLNNNVLKNCFKGFLTEEEVNRVLKGEEIWLNYESLLERSQRRNKEARGIFKEIRELLQ